MVSLLLFFIVVEGCLLTNWIKSISLTLLALAVINAYILCLHGNLPEFCCSIKNW